MDFLHLLLIFVVGIVVGFINVIGAGGSFITLAVLIAIGLPPTVANGTNRLNILIQNIFASAKFHRLKILDYKFTFSIAIPLIIGSLAGTYIAVHISDAALKKIIAVLMILVTAATIYNPQKFSNKSLLRENRPLKYIVFFLIGIYGGFIQAGVGFFLIAATLWSGFSMLESNAIKVMSITIYTALLLPIFIMYHQVNFLVGIVIGMGSIIGAKIAISLSIRKGDKFIRIILLLLLSIFAVKLFFF